MKYITVHCSATRPRDNYSEDLLYNDHVKTNGWSAIGYHFYIKTNGNVIKCRNLNRDGAHVKGHNKDNIGICLEGGLDNETGKPSNTFNSYQFSSLSGLIKYLQAEYEIFDENILGHRDWEGVKKDCPCFDVKKWVRHDFN